MMARTEKGRIVHPGMGGFLNPPTHPEHDWHVETDLRRRPENRGGMSLSGAAKATWLDSATRAEARRMLNNWQPPPINNPEIEDWRQQILGYFRGMYRNPNAPSGEEWNASTMIHDPKRDPIANADEHAGVHFIRKFYPDYTPTRKDFSEAYWGSRPERPATHERRSGRRENREAVLNAAGVAERKQSMTYGTLPPYKEFLHDIHTNIDPETDEPYWPESMNTYPMELVSEREIELAYEFGGLQEFDPVRGSPAIGPRYGFRGDEKRIYEFLQFLVKQDDDGEDDGPWALASSIMYTLGYEWV